MQAYSIIIFNTITGYLLWKEKLDALSIIGCTLVLISFAFVYKFREPARPNLPKTALDELDNLQITQ
jgi:drug/metabolite transporter (DMT)-like permease